MLAGLAKSVQFGSVALKNYPRLPVYSHVKHFCDKIDSPTEQKPEVNDKLGSFAKAFNELEQINAEKEAAPVENLSFKKLIRQSTLVDVSFEVGCR